MSAARTLLSELNDFGLVPQFFLRGQAKIFDILKKERYPNNKQNFKENRTAGLVEWRQFCMN